MRSRVRFKSSTIRSKMLTSCSFEGLCVRKHIRTERSCTKHEKGVENIC